MTSKYCIECNPNAPIETGLLPRERDGRKRFVCSDCREE